MTHANRQLLETTADRYLRNGYVNQCLDIYRKLGQPRKYVASLRRKGNSSLLEGDAKTAISAFVIAGYLDLTTARRVNPRSDRALRVASA